MIQFRKGTLLVMASLVASGQLLGAHPMQDTKPNGCNGVSLCHAYPDLDNNGIHLDIGFILEQMRVTSTDVGYTSQTPFSSLPKGANILRPQFKLSWGVTCELGYEFTHDNWYVGARFDWLRSEGKKSSSGTWTNQVVPTGIWTPTMLNGPDVTYFTDAKTRLRVNYFALEADINRGSFLTEALSFEPHAGLKAAWIYFNQSSDFTGGPAGILDLDRSQHNTFWGIGPAFGFDSKWFLIEKFSFFCDTSMALLFGNSRVKDKVSYDANINICQTYAKERMNVMSPAARAILGFMYERYVNDDTQHISFRVGLDTNFYWNQFSRIEVVNNPYAPQNYGKFYSQENNSFGMVGLLVEFGWDF